MVFHGEENNLTPAHQIEHEIFVRHEFVQVVFFAEEFAQFLGKRFRFCRFDGVSQERSTGLREPAEGGNDFVEEAVEELMKCRPAVRGGELFDGGEID